MTPDDPHELAEQDAPHGVNSDEDKGDDTPDDEDRHERGDD